MKLKLILGAAVLITMTACTRPEASQEILEAHGYTDVDVGGYAAFGCGEDDTFRTVYSELDVFIAEIHREMDGLEATADELSDTITRAEGVRNKVANFVA